MALDGLSDGDDFGWFLVLAIHGHGTPMAPTISTLHASVGASGRAFSNSTEDEVLAKLEQLHAAGVVEPDPHSAIVGQPPWRWSLTASSAAQLAGELDRAWPRPPS